MLQRAVAALCVWICCTASYAEPAPRAHHALWSLRGEHNTVYLMGSVHFLNPSEKLPAAMDAAYLDAEALVMEIDMDDLDPLDAQQATFELGVLPPEQSLEMEVGSETFRKVAAKAEELGLNEAVLNRFRPWLAAITLVQMHLQKMGMHSQAGVEQRLTARAAEDKKPIEGLESMREQLGLLAALPAAQQREFLLYSVEDAERATAEIEKLLAAWRQGDAPALAELLSEGFEEYPDLYRPLTTERNRKWLPKLESLLDDKQDYLVVVGALHLVGDDSVIDLLERKGHKVTQH